MRFTQTQKTWCQEFCDTVYAILGNHYHNTGNTLQVASKKHPLKYRR